MNFSQISIFLLLIFFSSFEAVANDKIRLKYSPKESKNSIYVSCDVKKGDVAALVTLTKIHGKENKVIRRSYMKSLKSGLGKNQIGMELHFVDVDKGSEWKNVWILEGYGAYEIAFVCSDGMNFKASFNFLEDLGTDYVEIFDLDSEQKNIPKWVSSKE